MPLLMVLVPLSAAMLGTGTQGCSPIECSETETCPGLGPDGASVEDGSTHVEDGNAAEAGSDDGSAAPDVAPGDAADAGDATPIQTDGGFCASLSPQPRFCDDFDEHALPGAWTSFTQTGGTLMLDPTVSVSPPNSLVAKESPLASGQPLDTAVRTQFPLSAPPTTIGLDFQFQPVQADPDAGAATVVASLDFTDAVNNRYTVQFTLVQQGVAVSMRLEEQAGFIDGGSSYVSHPLPDPLGIGTWTPIALKVNRTGANTATATVTFGSATEINDVALAMSVNATLLQLTIGSSFESEPSAGWENRYDNVVLDIQPP